MQPLSAEEALAARGEIHRLIAQVERVIVGKRALLEMAAIALLARGHILIEDIPGVGKTTLAKAMARAVGGSFKRLQFTPDLLPGDVTGLTTYSQKSGEFFFNPGPVFANIVLADEINRATPKTQSALLEAMEESQVTADGITHPLPQPFLVIATQNPIEYRGTYPLPEAQMDRFLMRVSIGYPQLEEEIDLLERHARADSSGATQAIARRDDASTREGALPEESESGAVTSGESSQTATLLEGVEEALSVASTRALQAARMRVHVAPELRRYIVALCDATRRHHEVRLGVSPRGSLALQRAAQAAALLAGREYATPDDVKSLALPVLSHRLLLQGRDERDGGENLMRQILTEVPITTNDER